jgi:accessory colonization factor AcfC
MNLAVPTAGELIKEDIVVEEEEKTSTTRRLGNSFRKGDGASKNFEESEDVDGLIKWAKNLPDDIPLGGSQTSFFLK